MEILHLILPVPMVMVTKVLVRYTKLVKDKLVDNKEDFLIAISTTITPNSIIPMGVSIHTAESAQCLMMHVDTRTLTCHIILRMDMVLVKPGTAEVPLAVLVTSKVCTGSLTKAMVSIVLITKIHLHPLLPVDMGTKVILIKKLEHRALAHLADRDQRSPRTINSSTQAGLQDHLEVCPTYTAALGPATLAKARACRIIKVVNKMPPRNPSARIRTTPKWLVAQVRLPMRLVDVLGQLPTMGRCLAVFRRLKDSLRATEVILVARCMASMARNMEPVLVVLVGTTSLELKAI